MMRTADRTLAIAGCCVALATLVPVALFQAEVIDTLPDPPGEVFDSERITLSAAAHPLGVPDSFLGLASYGTTLALLLLADRNKVARRLLGVKLAGDAVLAAFKVVRQEVSLGKLCSWSNGSALATAAIVYGGRSAVVATAKEISRSV